MKSATSRAAGRGPGRVCSIAAASPVTGGGIACFGGGGGQCGICPWCLAAYRARNMAIYFARRACIACRDSGGGAWAINCANGAEVSCATAAWTVTGPGTMVAG